MRQDSTTRIVSICSRKKWYLQQVDTRFVNLMQMMYLLFAISIRLQAVTESFYCLNDVGKYCENESNILPSVHQKWACTVLHCSLSAAVLDFTYCPRSLRGWGRGRGVNWRVNSLNNFCSQKDFLGSSYIRVYRVDSSLGFTKEFQKNWIRAIALLIKIS